MKRQDESTAMPHDVEAEMAMLGCMILSTKQADRLISLLRGRSEIFMARPNRLVYESLERLRARGMVADAVTLKSDLRDREVLHEIGGADYLVTLMEETPSAHCAAHYASIVLEKAERRAVMLAGDRAHEAALDEASDLNELRRALKALGDLRIATSYEPRYLGDVVIEDGSREGCPTGFKQLDALTGGVGFPASQFSVIGARTGGGKSILMSQSARLNAEAGRNVVYALMFDLTPKEFKIRLLRQLCGWSRRPDNLELAANYDAALEELRDMFSAGSMKLYHAAEDGGDIGDLCAAIRDMHEADPIDVAYVDYAQKIRIRGVSDRVERMEAISEEVQTLAADLQIPIVMASQLSVDPMGGVTTKNARGLIEDSGFGATIEIGMTRSSGKAENVDDRAWLNVPKNRFGPQGPNVNVEFAWDKSHILLGEL